MELFFKDILSGFKLTDQHHLHVVTVFFMPAYTAAAPHYYNHEHDLSAHSVRIL